MEKISSFKDCKLSGLNNICGGSPTSGRHVVKYETSTGVSDKDVFYDGCLYRTVSNLESWFNRDRQEFH